MEVVRGVGSGLQLNGQLVRTALCVRIGIHD